MENAFYPLLLVIFHYFNKILAKVSWCVWLVGWGGGRGRRASSWMGTSYTIGYNKNQGFSSTIRINKTICKRYNVGPPHSYSPTDNYHHEQGVRIHRGWHLTWHPSRRRLTSEWSNCFVGCKNPWRWKGGGSIFNLTKVCCWTEHWTL